MKRSFDIFLSIVLIFLFLPVGLVLSILIKVTSKGPVIYWSKRVGRNNLIFSMPKFRSMLVETPEKATHLLKGSNQFITPIGNFLRKTSLDEIPQLWSILTGKMSFVGPRPALFNQYDLIELRTSENVHLLRPGLTGLAQISGRDELSIPKKVKYDVQYLRKRSFLYDLLIILRTVEKVLKRDGVKQA